MRTQNQPLTQMEQAFAEANHYIVDMYLAKRGLDKSEWYDVVIFRYLLSVQKWFRQPRLHQYKFSTIACQAMRSAIWAEQQKQSRRIKTVSLDAELPGDEGFTLMDTITYENLDYLYIGGDEMQIKYNVKNLPEKPGNRSSDETVAINAFIGTAMNNMVFEYDTEDEAKKRMNTLRSYINHKNLREVLEVYSYQNTICVIRKEVKKCR